MLFGYQVALLAKGCAKELGVPVLVHVMTRKGCGYLPAEEDPARFHGIGKFEPFSGKKLGSSMPTYSDIFGQTMLELAEHNPKICAITAAMQEGVGLSRFAKEFPDRFFDVGIAESHALTFAAGLAAAGRKPYVAIYSTFLQRGFDQIIQDIAMQHLHVVLAVDRAGLVGEDGETHHGIYDVGFLRQVPGMKILAPVSLAEQQDMLRWAVKECTGPVAVRYPRGTDGAYTASDWHGFDAARGALKCHRKGEHVTLITYGTMLNNVMGAAALLAELEELRAKQAEKKDEE